MSYDLVVRGGAVVLEGQGLVACDIGITDGVIRGLGAPLPHGKAAMEVNAKGLHVLPGGIDSHTHWGYRGEFANDVREDSRAAALGGTTTAHVLQRFGLDGFETLKTVAENETVVDFAFAPTIYNRPTAAQITEAVEEWGCTTFKFYLSYKRGSGMDPGDDWNELTDGLMVEALKTMSRYRGVVACVHAENAEIVAASSGHMRSQEAEGLIAWERGNPAVAEVEAIQRAAVLCEEEGVSLYLVHLSGERALEAVGRARQRWTRISAETCPHYLFHTADTAPPIVKFSPPVRYVSDKEALWAGIASGSIDCIGSDNTSMCASAKEGSVWQMTRGGPGAGLILPVLLSEGVNQGRVSVEQVARVTSTNAARLFRLYPRKGTVGLGADADLVLVDLKKRRVVRAEDLGVWAGYTLYDEVELQGWPVITILRGQIVATDGEVTGGAGVGTYLWRRPAEPILAG